MRKFFLFFGIIQITSIGHTQEWTILGSTILGTETEDMLGDATAISRDGNTIAVGSQNSDDGGFFHSGKVQVFEWSGSEWTPKGDNFVGTVVSANMGRDVELNEDGNILAIHSEYNGILADAGVVTIYEWDGIAWEQKGSSIDGEELGERAGNDLSISDDGNIVVVGAPYNDFGGSLSGRVRVFEWDGDDWVLKGSPITGTTGNRLGFATSMNTAGTVIALGNPQNDNTGDDAGSVRVYAWNGSNWELRGSEFFGVTDDRLGQKVSLDDTGNVLAIGAPGNSDAGLDAGKVMVYDWDGSEWVLRGTPVYGEAGDDLGFLVNITGDGSRFTAGAPEIIRSYLWNDEDTWEQVGEDILSDFETVSLGVDGHISQDGNRIIAGAPFADVLATNAGSARVYELCSPTFTTDTQEACQSYTWIDGNTYTSSTDIPTYTLSDSFGCDSIINLNLTINTVNVSVSVVMDAVSLEADAEGLEYQWLDCDNDFSPISGETSRTFTPDENGNYAVKITDLECTDTSECFLIDQVSISQNTSKVNFSAFPNPTNNFVKFQSDQDLTLVLYDCLSQEINRITYNSLNLITIDLPEPSGLYYLGIIHDNQPSTYIKLIKK